MELTALISSLLETGKVQAESNLVTISERDRTATIAYLHEYYEQDKIFMPLTAPGFDKAAAGWSALYFFDAVQLMLARDAAEKEIELRLQPFTGEKTAAAIYTVDLVFRHLHALCTIAKQLAPADKLVSILHATAAEWPYSSVGTGITPVNLPEAMLTNESLIRSYAERIIETKDNNSAKNPAMLGHLQEAIGAHGKIFWPENELLQGK